MSLLFQAFFIFFLVILFFGFFLYFGKKKSKLPAMIEHLAIQIKALLSQNRKVEAVSLAFEQMGSLSEAKSYIAQLEDELSAPVIQEIVKLDTEVVYEEVLDSTPSPDMDEVKKQALHILIQEGSKLKAVKWVKEQTGWGLKESKFYVDDLQTQEIVPEDTLDAMPKPDMGEINKQVLHLIQEGLKLKAVKWVREQLGWGMKESKIYVDNLQTHPNAEIEHANLLRNVTGFLKQKKKIEAIKFVKGQTNWSLREAKDYVDNIEDGLQL